MGRFLTMHPVASRLLTRSTTTTRRILHGGTGTVVSAKGDSFHRDGGALMAMTALSGLLGLSVSSSHSSDHAVQCDSAAALVPNQANSGMTSASSHDGEVSSKEDEEKRSRNIRNSTHKNNDNLDIDDDADDGTFEVDEHYDVVQVLGEGGYGTVFLAKRRTDGQSLALKAVPREHANDVQREVRALRHLTRRGPHPHVIRLMDLHQDDAQYYLGLELVDGGELMERLIEDGPYSEAQAAGFIRQFAEALCFCHDTAGWLHGDLKLENLLLSSRDYRDAVVKVVDFGCAVPIDHDTNAEGDNEDFAGTPFYWPPELFAGQSGMTAPADMWAAGVIVYILVTGSHPFDKYCDATDDDLRQMVLDVARDPKLLDKYVWDERVEPLSESCRELMRQLLHPDPEQRMTSDAFRRHPWVQGLTASWELLKQSHHNLQTLGRRRFRDQVLKKFAASLGLAKAVVNSGGADGDSDAESSSVESLPQDILSDENLAQIFQALDLKHNGVLELEEIQQTFRDLGVPDEDISEIFECADVDCSGVVKFDEFVSLMRNQTLETFWQNRFRSEIVNKFAAKLGISTGDGKNALSDADLHRIFHALDLKQNGVVDREELEKVFEGLGVSEQDVAAMFASSDLDSSQMIHFDEFQALMKYRDDKNGSSGSSLHDEYRQGKFRSQILKKYSGSAKAVPEDKLREMFDAMDTDQNGTLDPHEIRVVLRSMGESENFISQIVATIDHDHDGVVPWEDFVRIMRASEDEEEAKKGTEQQASDSKK